MTDAETIQRVTGCQGRGKCGCSSARCAATGEAIFPFELFPDAKPVGRVFETGAYRDGDTDKLDYEGFFSPLVLTRRAEYMHRHRVQSNGEMRDSDNWQLGIPKEQYMKSLFRHFVELWTEHRALLGGDGSTDSIDTIEEAICALMFNCEGLLHELLTNG